MNSPTDKLARIQFYEELNKLRGQIAELRSHLTAITRQDVQPGTPKGRKGGKLTPAQVRWHSTWPGPVVRSPEEALKAIGAQ